MENIVRIPASLRNLTNGVDEVAAAGATVGELIDDLEQRHPGLRHRILDGGGIRRFVNLYVGGEDVRYTGGLSTAVKPGDEIAVVTAIAGG